MNGVLNYCERIVCFAEINRVAEVDCVPLRCIKVAKPTQTIPTAVVAKNCHTAVSSGRIYRAIVVTTVVLILRSEVHFNGNSTRLTGRAIQIVNGKVQTIFGTSKRNLEEHL